MVGHSITSYVIRIFFFLVFTFLQMRMIAIMTAMITKGVAIRIKGDIRIRSITANIQPYTHPMTKKAAERINHAMNNIPRIAQVNIVISFPKADDTIIPPDAGFVKDYRCTSWGFDQIQ